MEITRDRQFLVNGQPIPRAELPHAVATLYETRANRELFIRADRDLDFREVAVAMDAMHGADSSVRFGLLSKK